MITSITELRSVINGKKAQQVNRPTEPVTTSNSTPTYVRLNRPAVSRLTHRYLPKDSLGFVLSQHEDKWMIRFPGVIAAIDPKGDLVRVVE